jgi:hypothetical protein
MSGLKEVELVRRRVSSGMVAEMTRFRVWLSMVEGNGPFADLLRGDKGDAVVAELVETVMCRLGHSTRITNEDNGDSRGRASQAKKVVRGAM